MYIRSVIKPLPVGLEPSHMVLLAECAEARDGHDLMNLSQKMFFSVMTLQLASWTEPDFPCMRMHVCVYVCVSV